MSRSYKLAPMSSLIKVLTILCWLLPILFGVYGLFFRQGFAIIVLVFLLVLYGAVWIWCRPSHFVVSPNHLKIVFPGWQRKIPIEDLSTIRITNNKIFQQEFGWALRIGVGGLWGGFGWLWTSRRGFVEFYISRLDKFVLIERTKGNSLLLTPINPEEMVETVQEVIC